MKKILGLALMVATCIAPAFAKNSQNIHLSDDSFVGDVSVPKGDYKLTWEGTGPVIEIAMASDGKQILKAQARVVEQKNNDVSVSITNQGGHPILQTIKLHTMTLIVGMPVK